MLVKSSSCKKPLWFQGQSRQNQVWMLGVQLHETIAVFLIDNVNSRTYSTKPKPYDLENLEKLNDSAPRSARRQNDLCNWLKLLLYFRKPPQVSILSQGFAP